MHKLQSSAKMMLFLLWFGPEHKGATSWIIGLTGPALGMIWGFSFDNLPFLYMLPKEKQIQLRGVLMVLWFVLFALTFIILHEFRNTKYKDIPHLTKEELDAYNNYFNIPKTIPHVRRTW